MIRFNTTNNNIEVYDNSQWAAVGAPVFTVIADEQFNGDGSTVVFTLTNGGQTTNSCIISINGVVQIPTLAYAVSGAGGNVLTFTEAPASGDVIDVRQITTTTTVTSISNTSGNAAVSVSDAASQVNVTGDLSVSGTILGGNLNSTSITNGNSNVSVVSSGGNVTTSVGGTSNVVVVSSTDVTITGNLTVTGNATLSGNILGDRIQNGNTQIDIQTVGGNANVTVGGTSNVAVFATTGVFITGENSVSGNITGGNLSVSTGTITVGNIVNSNANGVGNIGTSSTRFNQVFALASSAQYADLAEKYVADSNYKPGTVVMFGGDQEITLCVNDACSRVAGVVSTNPAFIMNDTLESTHVAAVALTGRVPTRVTGTVRKGDMMVSAGNGAARAEAHPKVGTVIGKALADSEGDAVIEVVVGRV
jgi:hypothetical protein